MLVKGRWHEFPGETVRPIIEASVLTADGEWEPVTFLLDAGADRKPVQQGDLPGARARSRTEGPHAAVRRRDPQRGHGPAGYVGPFPGPSTLELRWARRSVAPAPCRVYLMSP